MENISLHQFFTVFTWFGLTGLLSFLALIARFYERLSQQRTYYQLFVIPILALAGGAVRLSQVDRVTGDGWGDILLAIGGASLAALCFHVYRLMTSGR
jgi:hypothetical protein